MRTKTIAGPVNLTVYFARISDNLTIPAQELIKQLMLARMHLLCLESCFDAVTASRHSTAVKSKLLDCEGALLTPKAVEADDEYHECSMFMSSQIERLSRILLKAKKPLSSNFLGATAEREALFMFDEIGQALTFFRPVINVVLQIQKTFVQELISSIPSFSHPGPMDDIDTGERIIQQLFYYHLRLECLRSVSTFYKKSFERFPYYTLLDHNIICIRSRNGLNTMYNLVAKLETICRINRNIFSFMLEKGATHASLTVREINVSEWQKEPFALVTKHKNTIDSLLQDYCRIIDNVLDLACRPSARD